MLHNAIPASATALPIARLQPTQSASIEEAADAVCVTSLATWARSIGHTVADVATLLFVTPIPPHLRAMFEDRIRQEVATELLRFDITDDEADRVENIAWLAFQRRVRAHALALRSTRAAGAPGLRFPG